MKVEMEHVKSHVTRTYHSDERIHVGSVIVKESAALMYKRCDFLDILLEESESVRIGHHDTCDRIVKKWLQILNVNKTILL